MIHHPTPEVIRALWSTLIDPAQPNGLIGIGIDVVDVAVLSRQLEGELGRHFVDRTFTLTEISDSRGRADRLATRWALKEAVAKAIGTGFRHGLRPGLVEVLTAPSGAVSIRPTDGATWPLGAARWGWAVSACHESGFATAIAVAVGPPAE